MATHSSTLAWKIPWMEEHGRLQSMGSQRAGHDWATSLFFFTHTVKSQECFPVLGSSKVIVEVKASRRNHGSACCLVATVVPVSYSFNLVWLWHHPGVTAIPTYPKEIKTENVWEVSWSPVVIKLWSSNAEPRLAFVLSRCLHHVANGALSPSLHWQMRGEACHKLCSLQFSGRHTRGLVTLVQAAAWTSWGQCALRSLTRLRCSWLPLMISLFKVSHKKLYF